MPRVKDNSAAMDPPPAGLHQAVCVDIVGPVIEQSPWGLLNKVQIRWQLDAINPKNSKPFIIPQKYTFSLNEKANLRNDLECWLGRPLTDDEVNNGFELDELIGENCQLQIVHKLTKKGRQIGVVQAIVPLGRGMVAIGILPSYVKDRDRPKPQGITQTSQTFDDGTPVGEPPEGADEFDDIPF